MSSSQLEQIVHHDGRLNVLSCLVDNGLLSASELASRIGKSVQAVRYWLRLLETSDLVEQVVSDEDEPPYAVTLNEQPGWVREAVRKTK